MKKIIILLLICLAVCNCRNDIGKYQLIEFDNAMLEIAEKKIPAWICIGDFNVINEMKVKGLSKSIRKFAGNYDFYFCDISIEENEHINYIYQLESLPVIVLVTPDRKISYIINSNTNSNIIEELENISRIYQESGTIPKMTNSNFDIEGEDLSDMYSDVYSAYITLNKGDESSYDREAAIIDTSIEINPYFYNLYLGYKLHSAVGDYDIARQYYKNAISWFEDNYAPLYTYLCLELVKNNEGDTAEIEIETQSIDFGKIPAGEVTTKNIRFKNTGTAILMIINASASCPCVQLDWTGRVMPGEYGEIRLHYHADDTKGLFHRNVILVPNTPSGSKMLSIRGEII